MKIKTSACVFFIILVSHAFCQNTNQSATASDQDSVQVRRYSVSTTWLSFANFGDEKTNTHHYELHFKYRLTANDKIGIKIATWKMFAPMGMPLDVQFEFDENNFYSGRLRETGLGATYQRMIWKGLFATVEILPQLKTYVAQNGDNIGSGFKLYTSYHIGYHIPLFKDRMFIEPQIHCQYWPIDTNTPAAFRDKESKWNNYLLFEPNLYIGVNF